MADTKDWIDPRANDFFGVLPPIQKPVAPPTPQVGQSAYQADYAYNAPNPAASSHPVAPPVTGPVAPPAQAPAQALPQPSAQAQELPQAPVAPPVAPVAESPAAAPVPAPVTDPENGVPILPHETAAEYARRSAILRQSDMSSAWDVGVLGLKQLVAGAATGLGHAAEGTAVGDALGAGEVRQWGLEQYNALEKEMQPYQANRVTKLEQIEDIGDLGRFAAWSIGQMAPSVVESLGMGLIGAAMGAGIPGAVTGVVGKTAAKTLISKKLAELTAKHMVGKTVTKEATKAAEQAAMKQLAPQIGAGMAMFAAGTGMGFGDIYGEIMDEEGKGNVLVATALAPIYGAIDSFTEMSVFKGIAKGGGGDAALARYAKAMLGGGTKEGAAEMGQEGLLMLAGVQTGKEYTKEEVYSRLGNAFAAALIGGGAMSAAGGRNTQQADAAREADTLSALASVGLSSTPNSPELLGVLGDTAADPQARMDAVTQVAQFMEQNGLHDISSAWQKSAEKAINDGLPIVPTSVESVAQQAGDKADAAKEEALKRGRSEEEAEMAKGVVMSAGANAVNDQASVTARISSGFDYAELKDVSGTAAWANQQGTAAEAGQGIEAEAIQGSPPVGIEHTEETVPFSAYEDDLIAREPTEAGQAATRGAPSAAPTETGITQPTAPPPTQAQVNAEIEAMPPRTPASDQYRAFQKEWSQIAMNEAQSTGRFAQGQAKPPAAAADRYGEGETIKTATGRDTTAFPRVDASTERKAKATRLRRNKWLIENAVAEAQARGDEVSGLQFNGETARGLPQASIDAMNDYLFGDYIPPAPAPITKPTGGAQADANRAGDVAVKPAPKAKKPSVEGKGPVTEQIADKEPVAQPAQPEAKAATTPEPVPNAENAAVEDKGPLTAQIADKEPVTETKPAAGASQKTEDQAKAAQVSTATPKDPAADKKWLAAAQLRADLQQAEFADLGTTGATQAPTDTTSAEQVKEKDAGAQNKPATPETTKPAREPATEPKPSPGLAEAKALRKDYEQNVVGGTKRKLGAFKRKLRANAKKISADDDAAVMLIDGLVTKAWGPESRVDIEYGPAIGKAEQSQADGAPPAKQAKATPSETLPTPKLGADLPSWWDKELTLEGRRIVVKKAGLKSSVARKSGLNLSNAEADALGNLFVDDGKDGFIEKPATTPAAKPTSTPDLSSEPAAPQASQGGPTKPTTNEEQTNANSTPPLDNGSHTGRDPGRPSNQQQPTGEGQRDAQASKPGGDRGGKGGDEEGAGGGAQQRRSAGGRDGGKGVLGSRGDGDRGAAPSTSGGVPGAAGADLTEAQKSPVEQAKDRGEGVIESFNLADVDLANGGPLTRARTNVEALKIVKALQFEQRRPTAEEQSKVAQYIGFGDSRIRQQLFPVGKEPNGSWAEIAGDLENLLTPDELAEVKQSTQYAHYTSKEVVQSVWAGLKRLGATRGIAFEAGVGSGNFIGLKPAGMQLRYQGIEREPIAAGVAQALYPDAGIIKGDFQEVALVQNHYDVLIGNPPFSDRVVKQDKDYARLGFSLHNYFLAKQIDALRPGGVGAFVVSHYLMDAKDSKAREHIGKKADLVGAIRLPNTAFKQNAGTDVVTDILFFKKRVPNVAKKFRGVTTVRRGEQPGDSSWLQVAEVSTQDGQATINGYFAAHPENVLGEHSLKGSMTAQETEYTVLPHDGKASGDGLAASLQSVVDTLPKDIYSWNVEQDVDERISRYELAPAKQDGSFYQRANGDIWQVESGVGVKVSPQKAGKARAYLPLKKAVMDVFKAQSQDKDGSAAQADMMKHWKAFVKKYGALSQEKTTTSEAGNTQTRVPNESALSSDPEFFRVQAIEKYDSLTDTVKPGSIFTQKIIGKEVEVKAESALDAMTISLNKQGGIDPEFMRTLYPADMDDLIAELGDSAYKEPTSGMYVPRDQYLSGNVRAKLASAKDAAKTDVDYQRNVSALEAVQPENIGAGSIYYPLAAQWIPAKTVQRFAEEVLDFNGRITSWAHAGQGGWTVEGASGNDSVYGTSRVSATEVLEAALQQKRLTVTDPPPSNDMGPIINKEETLAANVKVQEIRDGFDTWVKANSEELDQLSEVFNLEMNVTVPWSPDGSHLTLPGFTSRYTPHPWQKNLAWRFAVNGNTYAAHAVGAGKTLATVISVMEARRLGLIKKAVVPVPKSTLSQWRNEWRDAYPNANILVINQNELTPSGRRKFWAKAAMQDWDAIIVTHDAFKSLGLNPETTNRILSEDLRELDAALDAMEDEEGGEFGKKSATRSQIEKAREKIEDMIAAAHKKASDAGVTFEDIGIDLVVVDEAHTHKKMGFATEQSDIKGVNGEGSGLGIDLFSKARYLRESNPTHSLIMLSGTPITNSIGEIFQVQRLMQPEVLERMNAETFDSWSASFATTSTGLAMGANGEYKTDTRMIEVRNRAGLVKDLHAVMDVVDMDDLVESGVVNLPKIKGGQREIRIIPASDDYAAYQEELGERLQTYADMKMHERKQKGAENIPWIMSDGAMAAIDLRLVGREQTSDSKVVTAAKEVARIYKAHKNDTFTTDGVQDKAKGAVQLVFSDKWAKEGGFDASEALVDELVKHGVPRNKILNVKTLGQDERKRKRTWRDANMGKYAVLIGGTKTLGTGVNVQKRAYATHHLDAPLVPADITQREGRIIRNGNQNDTVEVIAWGKEGSIEAFNWQLVEKKQRMIDSAMNKRDLDTMVIGDMDSDADQMALAMAMVSGDPRVMERAGLQADVRRYEAMQGAHHSAQADQARKLRRLQDNLPKLKKAASTWAAAASKTTDTKGDKFKMAVGFGEGNDRIFTSRKKAGEALIGLLDSLPDPAKNLMQWDRLAGKQLAEIGGHKLVVSDFGYLSLDGMESAYLPIADRWTGAKFKVSKSTPLGAVATVENSVRGIGGKAESIAEEVPKVEKLIKRKEEQAQDAPEFAYAGELKEKKARLAKLDAELAPPVEETEGNEGGGTAVGEAAETGQRAALKPKTLEAIGAGQSVEFTQAVIDSVVGGLKGIEGWTVRAVSSLPGEPLAGAQRGQGGNRVARAVFDPDKKEVLLVAPYMKDRADILRTLMHELVKGHYGMRQLLGPSFDTLLDRVAKDLPADVKRVAAKYGYDTNKTADRRKAADELLAELAETHKKPRFMHRVYAAIRRMLRQAGIDIALSKGDLDYILSAAARGVEQGRTAATMREARSLRKQYKPGDAAPAGDTDGTRYALWSKGRPTQGKMASGLADQFDAWMSRRKRPTSKNLTGLNRSVGTPFHIAQKNKHFKAFHDELTAFNETRSTVAHNAESLTPNLFADQEHGLKTGWASAKRVYARSNKKEMAAIEAALNDLVEEKSGRMSNRNFTDADLRKRGFTDEMIGTYRQILRSTHYSLDLSAQSLQMKNFWNLLKELHADSGKTGYDLTKVTGDIAKKIMVEGGTTVDAMDNAAALMEPYITSLADQETTSKAQLGKAKADLAKAQAAHQAIKATSPAPDALASSLDKVEDARKDVSKVEGDLKQVAVLRDRIGNLSVKNPDGSIKTPSKGTLGAIEGIADTVADLKSRSYFPLMRFGKYTLTVWDQGSKEPAYFARYETEAEQQIAAEAIEKELNPDQSLETGMYNEKAHELYEKINMDTLAIFADHIEDRNPDGSATKQVDLLREYIRLGTADNSPLKRELGRKGTPGWSKDTQRVLASYILSSAGMVANNTHMADINGSIADIPRSQGDVQQYAQELKEYTADPGEEMSGLRNFMFFWYLGGSLASAAVNLTQIPMVTYPYLMQYGNAKTVTKVVMDAYRAVKAGDVGKQDTPLGRAYKQAELDGIIAPQQIYALMGTARGGTLGTSRLLRNPGVKFLQQLWAAPFGWAEQVNRSVTFISSFNMAMEGGQTEAQALEFAKHAVDETQFVYNKTNRPAWARGVMAPVFTFKTFTIQYLELLYRLPKKQKLQMLGMLLLASGVGGLPGEEDMEDVIDTIMQIVFGKAWQTRDELKKFTENVLGETFGEIAMEGISAAGLPIDLQRLGMGNILPGTGAFLPGGAGQKSAAGEVLGPASGLIKDAMKAVENVGRGDFGSAGFSLMPKAIKNAIDGGLAMESGNYIDSRGRAVMPVSFAEAMAKSIGFQPRRVAEYQEQKWSLMKRATLHRTMEDAFLDRMARAKVANDTRAYQAARQEVKDWNKRNPDDKIEYSRNQILSRVKGIKAMSEERFLKSLPVELRNEAMGAFGH